MADDKTTKTPEQPVTDSGPGNGKHISQYTCSQYSKVPVGKLCTTQHRINEDVVLSLRQSTL